MIALSAWYRDRLADIIRQYREGVAIERIAAAWYLSPERVRAILLEVGEIERRR